MVNAGDEYEIYAGFPTETYLFLPGVDNNNNPILEAELAYNGYYIVFETPNPLYSNANNSNIFYRKIGYYDNIERIAYFDTPLPFNYDAVTTPQQFTLRKTLPNERWALSTPTFYNTTPPVNPQIGPQIGYVITLPSSASSVDNFYRGKYVYFSSNAPETYSPPYPDPYMLIAPLPNLFYPVYGSFYIKAYNGTTKQLSVLQDKNDKNLPTYAALPYDSSAFSPPDAGNVGILSIVNTMGTEYRAELDRTGMPPIDQFVMYVSGSNKFKAGLTYTISITIKVSPNITNMILLLYGAANYQSPVITSTYQTFTFETIPINDTQNIYLNFIDGMFGGAAPYYIYWNAFSVVETDTINITSFSNDNFSPLSYNGSMVSQNQTVCYEVSLISLTLPNLALSAGSRIAFYPFVYVEFVNATSPSGASNQIIYSNNPASNKALFIAAVGNVSNPGQQSFVNLTGGSMTQTIKFKPNDNLRFSVYLPDGSLFEPLAVEIYSPYPPDIKSQIDAVFGFRRLDQNANSNFTIL